MALSSWLVVFFVLMVLILSAGLLWQVGISGGTQEEESYFSGGQKLLRLCVVGMVMAALLPPLVLAMSGVLG